MKKILNYQSAISATIMMLLVASCSLDEFNPSTVDLEVAYSTPAGFESLVNYCYDGLYYFYGKIDGIGIMEMGTDLWFSESKEKGFTNYGSDMSTEMGTLRVFWQGFYSTINYCNMAIYYADQVKGYTEDERNAKVAEAYFLRGWSNLHIVEQFGGVVLRTEPSSVTGPDNSPVRSTEAEFYDLIISDLKFACEHLPLDQGFERGRVSKKAAYGMLAKAYLQRTRLGEANTSEYARLALEAAREIIDNQGTYDCVLYTSDDVKSGYSKLWDGENNKTNQEFLFIEAVDHETFLNPDGDNRGRTRQYYEMDLKTVGAQWGTTEKNCAWYGRANDRGFKPTKYLLTEIFKPEKDPADTRFEETFFTQYYNSTGSDFIISQALADRYSKDASIVGDTIKNTLGAYNTTDVYYGGRSYYGITASGNTNMVDDDGDGYLDGISIFAPNYTIPADEKSKLPFMSVDPTDMFESDGRWVTALTLPLGTAYKDCYPSMRKFSSLYWIYNNQKWEGDVPILRLGEVYLIAAEAALRYNNDQSAAAGYVNTIRQRAAVTGRANEMTVDPGEVTLDFILEERARELAGEQVRWCDLKRFGKLTSAYLSAKNPDIVNFDDAKNTVRPVPQSFLDAIVNSEEFGSNGY
ncbi:MAG: RagB/SusD family nutrient uptake outer membrane protein [Bacteroidales bacterium]|nr:RagB/SusD family nutrient uptake outer membrane protein [Bacteroidales bacterium]